MHGEFELQQVHLHLTVLHIQAVLNHFSERERERMKTEVATINMYRFTHGFEGLRAIFLMVR